MSNRISFASKHLRLFAGTAWLVVLCLAAAARSDEVNDQIGAHLKAGEFPAAQVLAQNLGPDARDAAMARIAAMQWRSGARRGWANTVGGIGDDQIRSGAFSMAGPMFAGQSPGFAGQSPGFGLPRGGGVQADFTALINLIQKTTGLPKPGWVDDGGVGEVEEFRGGVWVDASGMLRRAMRNTSDPSLSQVRDLARATSGNRDVRRLSQLRKVSLTRLEREVLMRRANGEPLDESLRYLAGINKIEYVLVYPETGDIVLAGPAGAWAHDPEGRVVGIESKRPVLQLDDFVVLLRNAFGEGNFGCSINPREENLGHLKSFLEESARKPLKPGQRDSWLSSIRKHAGKQDIEVSGIDPRTRVAQVIVEADYRMKLVGLGLEEGVLGVTNYLDSVARDKNGPPPMEVLRWWFTLNYSALKASENHDAFALEGQGVKLLSENEMLNERGQRIHTGKSQELNQQFSDSFTKHFAELAAKYPIYAELKNIFDLALVAALLKGEDLPGQVGWHMNVLGDSQIYPVALGTAPKEVDSIINHRVINRTQVVAAVSGGVTVDARGYVSPNKVKTDTYGQLKAERAAATPKQLPENVWWWD